MSYEKLGFTSGQTLKAEHLNHMEEGIEAIANNVQVKKIVFTDRPSVYQWMLNNYSKVIYVDVICAQYPWHVKYTTSLYADDGTGNRGFGLVQLSCQSGTLVPSTIRLTSYDVTLMVDAKITINSDNTVTGLHRDSTVIPDEYWSVMEIECTAYYFDE